jgi:hypothetical protein
MPTSICGGRYDKVAPLANQVALFQQIPNARLTFFNGSHMVLWQDALAFPSQLVASFSRPGASCRTHEGSQPRPTRAGRSEKCGALQAGWGTGIDVITAFCPACSGCAWAVHALVVSFYGKKLER